jgi:uncharacterized protein (UPF0264 family)
LYKLLIGCGVLCMLLGGCSGDSEKEPGAIKKMTDTVAQQGVDYIKTPLDQAKRAQELSEAHNKTVEDAEARKE